MPERKLATIATVTSVSPIAGADRIEVAHIRGWNVVVGKNEYAPGDRCVYIEIDAFLPVHNPHFSFLASRGVKTVDGVDGHVLRTARLRGTLSQGLALPLSTVNGGAQLAEGTDVTNLLSISKYEPPIPAELSGRTVGRFPTEFASKTDAERVQNLADFFPLPGGPWLATEKVDGTSVTFINDNGVLRTCSRNWELSPEQGSTYERIATKLAVLDWLPPGAVVQGELYGEGVQSNPLAVRGHHFAIFAIWLNRTLLPRDQWPVDALVHAAGAYDLPTPTSSAHALELADGIRSLINPAQLAEGVVWHDQSGSSHPALDGRSCFKAISNTWLLKHEK